MARRIYFIDGTHTLFRELIEYPPDGYEFIRGKSSSDLTDQGVTRSGGLNQLTSLAQSPNFLPYFLTLWWSWKWYTHASSKRIPANADFIYSAHRIILERKPWVVTLEHIGDLCPVRYDVGHLALYRRLIEKTVGSPYCKKIMPYLEVGKRSLLSNLHSKKILDKIEVVHMGVHPKEFLKEYSQNKTTLLFVGTSNVTNIPGSFEVRGGKELLEAFAILSEKYENIELVIRARVLNETKKKYSHVFQRNNVKLYEGILPFEKYEHIMKSADLFLFPGYITPAVTILEAMSYELPVVASNIEGMSEMIHDGVNGFLIERVDNKPYTPTPMSMDSLNQLARSKSDQSVVKGLIEKTGALIEDASLRQKLGREGRAQVETGEFSIARRNEKLKSIFEEAMRK